jgi:hypothetical protein
MSPLALIELPSEIRRKCQAVVVISLFGPLAASFSPRENDCVIFTCHQKCSEVAAGLEWCSDIGMCTSQNTNLSALEKSAM